MLTLFFITSCAIFNPDEKMINQMAAEAYEKVKTEAKLSNNLEWKNMVDRVARKIAEESGQDHEWEWMLIESPEVNAWAMPGGKIAVYTGIMPIAKNEAGLAAILGHEVAHVTLDHGKERYAQAIRGNVAGLVIGTATAVGGQLLCKSESCQLLTGLGGAAAGFAITFFDRKFSREAEIEADKKGLTYMAQSGYEPTEAIAVWSRMHEATKGAQPPEFLSTHPSPETRKENIKGWLPEAQKEYSQSPNQLGSGQSI
ncbi:MAG: M48 family metallopeptidase [Bdellovibrionales bacterium]|nr:M48 family metallopeptidase [Bdellovibrionales bacterium]